MKQCIKETEDKGGTTLISNPSVHDLETCPLSDSMPCNAIANTCMSEPMVETSVRY